MKQKKNIIIALIINGLIILFEIIGLILSINDWGFGMFQFYTQDSNYFAFVASVLFEIYAIRRLICGTEIPKIVSRLRFLATSCLTLTFIVVLFVLIPMAGMASAKYMLLKGSMLYHHLLCPILSITSFLFFENKFERKQKELLISMIPTGTYAIVIITLNITKTIVGPYPFLYVYEQPVWMSIIWVIVILGIALFLSWILLFLKSKVNFKNKSK